MSDFGDILNRWESSRQGGKKQAKKLDLDTLYDAYAPPVDADIDDHYDTDDREASLKHASIQASLDLHGLTAEQARSRVMEFLSSCSRRGLRKVLIIHGKGYHSKGEPVLQRVVRECLEVSVHAGKSGRPKRELGGSGAVWVMIK